VTEMSTNGAIGWIKALVISVMGSFTFSKGSGLSSCIGSGDVGWEGTMVSCGGDGDFCGDGDYGGDGACSVMMVM
jgi:hypothetical protein